MKIYKPDDVLLLQGYHARGGKPALMVTLAYVVNADGTRMNEHEVWPWLLTHFTDEPFDTGFKKDRGVFGVAGAAYAPAGQRVRAMAVHVQMGALHKTLHVQGDRVWEQGLTGWQIGAAKEFDTMPITLSRAFGGGASPENPYGLGYVEGSEPSPGQALPNIELPDDPIVSFSDRPAVATFSALPAGAASRMRWVGRVDAAWERQRFPWLPDDTDPRWFDGVPSDQGHDRYWDGTESWSVQGMHPDQAQVSGQLPGIRPRLLLRSNEHPDSAVPASEAELDLDTVWLFPGEQRVMVMFRAAVAVSREDAADIAALGVFTEMAGDPSRTTAEWDKHWRELENTDVQEEPLVVPVVADDAELAQIRAEHDAAVQAWADDMHKDIQQSLDDGAQEANRVMARMERDMGGFADLDLPRAEAPRIIPLSVMQPAESADSLSAEEFEERLATQIQASLDDGRAAMEQNVREVAPQLGLDADELLEQLDEAAQSSAMQEDKTLVQHLAEIDMPDDVRDEFMAKAEAFQGQMDQTQSELGAMMAVPVVVPGPSEAAAGAAAPTLTVTDVQERLAAGQPLTGAVLSDLDFKGRDLQGADFRAALISQCDFSTAVLHNATFDQAQVSGCVFDQTDLHESSWHDTDVSESRFAGANLEHARLTNATFLKCQFEQACLNHAVLDGSSLGESGFDGASFVQACLLMTTLWSCRGKAVDFSQGKLDGIRIDTDTELRHARFVQASLSGASLQNSRFNDSNFNEAILSDAFISGCDLSGTRGWQADARRADFKGTCLRNARWIAANFMEASFDHAVLENLDLSGSNLHAIETRTATVRGVQVQGALLTRSRLLHEHTDSRGAS